MKTERIADSEDHITKEAVSHSATSLIDAGSVLIVTRSGILRHTLPVAVNSVSVTVNQDLKALTPRNGILAEYVAWALRAFSRDILHTCSKQGTTVNSVETSKLLGFEIPVAPRGQQAKIVAEIEKQFSRLDEAVANLKRVKANLKRYKAAVLKAAVEGKLTEDWRKQHPNIEPASKLLKRILTERRKRWHRTGKYKEPATPNIGDPTAFPAAPEGWAFASMEQLLPLMREAMKTGPFGSLLKKHEHKAEGVAVLGIENIEAMRFVRGSKIHITQKKAEDLVDYKVLPGDVLISRSGTVGEVCVVPEDIGEARISTNLMKISLARDGMLPKFFVLLFNGSPFVLNQISDLCKGSTRNFLNQEILKQLCFVLPSLPEQREIIGEVERRLSVIEELEAAVEANLTRADRLRQSILSGAFSGKLFTRENPPVHLGVNSVS
jgi:type I restriction enzyme S subunit